MSISHNGLEPRHPATQKDAKLFMLKNTNVSTQNRRFCFATATKIYRMVFYYAQKFATHVRIHMHLQLQKNINPVKSYGHYIDHCFLPLQGPLGGGGLGLHHIKGHVLCMK